ncbi:MAG: alpha/beta hydrolase [Marmoricola sp.]|nr:alpha/beta hydrolase [Marmoricola sp.]
MALSELTYDRAGAGEPVVLIHGIGHRRQAWEPVFDQLAASYDVIAVDLAGFGESPAYVDGVDYTMDNACKDLAANFAAWGIERPHVVGNSLGGAVCLELGARGLASSVTVLSPAGFFGRFERLEPFALLSMMRLASQLPDPVLHAVSRSAIGRRMVGFLLYAHPERVSADATYGDSLGMKHAAAFGRTIKAGLGYKFSAPIPVPTTVAWGTRDKLLRYRQAAVAQRQLPGSVHVPLPNCGHVPMIDDPELVISVIEATIGRANPAKAA